MTRYIWSIAKRPIASATTAVACGLLLVVFTSGHVCAQTLILASDPRLNAAVAVGQYNRGVELGALGRHEEAVHLYREAIRSDPALAEAYVNLGIELANLEQWPEALHALRSAVRVNPSLGVAHHNLGVVLAEMGHLREAGEAIRQAAQLLPRERSVRRALASTHFNLGVLYERRQLFTLAIEEFRKSLELDESADAYAGIGVSSFRLRRNEDAIKMFGEALRLRPSFAAARYNLAVAFAHVGRITNALDACRSALAERPDFHRARLLMNELLRMRALGTRSVSIQLAPLESEAVGRGQAPSATQ